MIPIRLLHFASRIIASNASRLRYPYKLNFMATSRCNQKCLHCGIWKTEEKEELTLREIRAFFNRSHWFSWVDISGGEIFLRPDILDIFATITEDCRRLFILHFATNGSLPEETEYLVREILRMGPPPRLIVTVSVDGPPEIHNRMRGAVGAFDTALDTYQRLSHLQDCRAYLGMTLTADNTGLYEKTLTALRARLPKITPADLHVNLMHRSGHYYGHADTDKANEADLDTEIVNILTKRPRRVHPVNILERSYLSLARQYLETGSSPLPCKALSATCFLRADGSVYPCVSWNRPLGNIRDHGYDLASVLDNSITGKARYEIEDSSCPGCWTPCEAVPAMLADYLPSLTRFRTQGKGASAPT